MVDEKTVQEVPEQEQQPVDQQRRKLLKIIGGGIGVIAVGGGAYLLGRGGAENGASTSTVPSEATATTQPSPNTTAPAPVTTSPESTPTTSPETVTTLPGETLSIPFEALPTSIDDPQVWIDKIYGLLHVVFNENQRDLLEYVYKGGESGNTGQSLAGVLNFVNLLKETYPEEQYVFDATLNEENTSLLGLTISVDETRSFVDNVGQPISTRRIVNFGILPEDVYINSGSGSEMITLYLINEIEEVCVFDENGVCH